MTRDRAAERELGAMIERHRRALTRREILVPLAILEEIVLRDDLTPDISR